MATGTNGWDEYRKLVLKELEDLGLEMIRARKDLSDIKIEIRELKIRSGIWGAIGGAIPVLLTIILYLIFTK